MLIHSNQAKPTSHILDERTLTMAERRARNRSLSSLLYTPSSYPGYISYLGCINRVPTTGQATFLPYEISDVRPPCMTRSFTTDIESCQSSNISCISPTPPLCSPEDDSEFAIDDDEWKSSVVSKKNSQNTSTSSGYGSTDSDQDEHSTSGRLSEEFPRNIFVKERKSRAYSRQEREEEKWRRRSVPASLRQALLPDDVIGIIQRDGHIRIETDVDTGEQTVMEIGSSLRRPESVMQLARRFGEIAAAQQNDLHKSRTSLYDGKENGCLNRSNPSTPNRLLICPPSDRRGGIASLKVAGTVAMAARPNIFKQMDKVGSSTSAAPPRPLNPNSIKDALLRWVQNRVKDYPVNVTNFSSSWADGTAFCALIHRFAPDAFDFNQIDPRKRKENFELAFRVAEDNGICPLLEVEDMIMMGDRPDWKCVFTYVQSFYKHFRDRE